MTRVIPCSNKAKAILLSNMESNTQVQIKLRAGDKVLFTSANGKYCSWVNLRADHHWMIVFS